jgi:hypothetical protein
MAVTARARATATNRVGRPTAGATNTSDDCPHRVRLDLDSACGACPLTHMRWVLSWAVPSQADTQHASNPRYWWTFCQVLRFGGAKSVASSDGGRGRHCAGGDLG